jgi:hypothetical protein
MRSFICAVLLGGVLAIGAQASPARGQGIEVGPGGVRVDPGWDRDDYRDRRYREYSGGISRREAIRAARSAGLDDVEGVSNTGRVWRVEGADRRGLDMTVIVHGRTGEVLSVRR